MDPKVAIIIIAVIVVILGVVAYFILSGPSTSDPTKIKAEIIFWNIGDNQTAIKPLLEAFNKKYRGIKVTYYKKSIETYEKDLLDAMASGQAPDVFVIGNTWLPRYKNKISPMPLSKEFITPTDFRKNFVNVASEDFIAAPSPAGPNDKTVYPEQIYAIPLFVDTLALYWNKDIFYSANIAEPPKKWEEFVEVVKKLTIKDEKGISRAGACLGTANNVNRATDILGLLMLQTGTKMVDDKKSKATFDQPITVKSSDGEQKIYEAGREALRFYTSFADPRNENYTWNSKMDYSIDVFTEGKAAMMINYSYHLATIKAKEPHLNFGIAPLPQPGDAKTTVNYANYWGLTVAKSADQNKVKAAWLFIQWLTESDNLKQYLQITNKPTSRVDLVNEQKNDLNLSVFAEQALSARSWYQVNPGAIEKIFSEMIEAVNSGSLDLGKAIKRGAEQVTQLMQ